MFADVPHQLKFIRNNLLGHGFTLHGNSKPTVTNGIIRELIIRGQYDLKTAHRLSHKHIDVVAAKNMNVRLAAQLLSDTTATSLKYFGEQGLLQSKDWEDTSNFIALVDTVHGLMFLILERYCRLRFQIRFWYSNAKTN